MEHKAAHTGPRMTGKLDEETFSDLCQALARQSGQLKLIGGNLTGDVYFDKGRIIHAETEFEEGKEALLDLATVRGGDFQFFKHVQSPKTSIHSAADSLMMEAAMYGDYMNGLRKKLILPGTFIGQGIDNCDTGADTDPMSRFVFKSVSKPLSLEQLFVKLKQAGVDRITASELILSMAERGCLESARNLSRVFEAEVEKADVFSAEVEPYLETPKRKFGWKRIGIAIAVAATILIGVGAYLVFEPTPIVQDLKTAVTAAAEPPKPSLDKEVSNTIETAKAFAFGMHPGGGEGALTPNDLKRLERSGFDSADILREIQRRGFTGYPDSFEAERTRGVVPIQVAHSLDDNSHRLNSTPLQEFVKKHPLNSGASAGMFDHVDPKNPQAEKISQFLDGIQKLEAAKIEFKKQDLPTTVLDLKIILLKERILEMTEGR